MVKNGKIRSEVAAKIKEEYKEKTAKEFKQLSRKNLKLIATALYRLYRREENLKS